MKIKFEGAAQTVTGSQTVVSHNHYSTLVDCGLYQGPKPLRLLNWEKPSYFGDIQSMILTHAHIDHARELVDDWRDMYNEFRPHRSLKGKTPKEFEREFKKQYQDPEVLSS